MDCEVSIIDRKEGEKAILYKPENGFSSVIGRYRPSSVRNEMEYIHFDDRFDPIIGKLSFKAFVPTFIPFRGMASMPERHILFKGEGIEFLLDMDNNKVLYSKPISAQE